MLTRPEKQPKPFFLGDGNQEIGGHEEGPLLTGGSNDRLKAPELMKDVYQGAKYVNGVPVNQVPEEKAA